MPASPATAAAASIARAGVGTWRRTATGGATSAASTSRAPRPWTVTAIGRREQDEQGEPQEGGPQPEGGRAGGIEGGGCQRAPERDERRAAQYHQHRGGHEVAAGHPERIAEQQLLQALRRVGSEGEQRPQADEPGDRDGGPGVGGDIRVARGKCDQRRRDDRPAQRRRAAAALRPARPAPGRAAGRARATRRRRSGARSRPRSRERRRTLRRARARAWRAARSRSRRAASVTVAVARGDGW